MMRNTQRGQDLVAGFDRSKLRSTKTQGGLVANLLTALAVLVIIGSFGTISWIVMKDASPKASETSEPSKRSRKAVVLFMREPAPIARDYDMTGKPKSVERKSFMMRIDVNRTETGLDAIDSELHEQCTKKISKLAADWSVKRGVAYFSLQDAEKFLTCSMRRQRSRFCDLAYRKRLVTRIKDYWRAREVFAGMYVMQKKMISFVENRKGAVKPKTKSKFQNLTPSEVQAMLDLVDGDEKRRSAKYIKRKQTQLGIPDLLKVDKVTLAFGRALSDLSGDGLIGVEDFGTVFSSPPKILLPYLKDAPNPC